MATSGTIQNINLVRTPLVAAVLSLTFSFSLYAADAPDPLQRTTPQSAVVTFLETCKAKDYARAVHYLDLSAIPEKARPQKGVVLAEQLEYFLIHNPQFDVANLSTDPAGSSDVSDGRDRVTSFLLNGKEVALELEHKKLRSGTLVWKFSAPSVSLIPQLSRATSESPWEAYLPDVLIDLKILTMPAWQWLAIFILAAGVAAIAGIARRLLPFVLVPIARRIAPPSSGAEPLGLVGPVELLLAAALFRAGLEWIAPPTSILLYFTRGLSFFLILGLAWLSLRLLDLFIARLRGFLKPTHPRFSSSVLPLLSRAVKVALLAFSLVAVLASWGYNTNTVLAGLGIGGIAVALAAQKTIENLFGGVAVVSDKPVFVGDVCKFGDSVGTVEDIGLRSTRIRTNDRTLVTIPNAQFSSMSLENFSRRDKMLFHPMLNLRRDTTPAQVQTLLDAIQKILTAHEKVETGKLPVRFIGVGSYSLDVEVFAYILTSQGDEFLAIQQDLLLRILEAVASVGTALALPTQASVVYSAPAAPPSREMENQNAVLAADLEKTAST